MFSVGIIGLPNVGKSTLFNALVRQELAKVDIHPFTTIKPNIGVISIPDERLDALAEMVEKEERGKKGEKVKKVAATIRFIDIAGLVKGAAQGAGLGNQFLGYIREVDAICFVLRDFEDLRVEKIGKDPKEDFETLKTELLLKDLETVEKNEKLKIKNEKLQFKIKNLTARLIENFNKGLMASQIELNEEEKELVKQWSLLTDKSYIVVINVGEEDLATAHHRPRSPSTSSGHLGGGSLLGPILVCAKLELELLELAKQEQKDYLQSLGMEKSGLQNLLKAIYKTLGLITFYTVKGGRQVTAWHLRAGSTALRASSLVHTDFAKKFIKAEVINWQKLLKAGSWLEASRKGWLALQGREYQVKDGDVVEFKLGG